MTRSIRRNATLLCLSIGLVFGSLADLYAAKAPVSSFARLPLYTDVKISPDGRYVAALRENEGRYFVAVYDLTDLTKKPYAIGTDKADAWWIHWPNSTRLLVSFRFPAKRFGTPTTETRLMSMKPDGTDQKVMIRQRRGERVMQIKDRVVDFLPHDPDGILMAYNKDNAAEPRVYRVDIYSGRGRIVQASRTNIRDWMADLQSRVRIGFGFERGTEFIIARSADAEDWTRIWEADRLSTDVFSPMLFKPDGNTLYVHSNHEGGTSGIYEFDLRQQKFTKKIFKRSDVEAGHVILDSTRTKLLGVSYIADSTRVHWLNSAAEQNHRNIENALGLGASVVSRSEDGSKAIVYASSPSKPGEYFIMDWQTKNLLRFAKSYPELESIKLSEPIAVTYRARDGLKIDGYLTLPPNEDLESARRLPTVIMPHGGPSVRDLLTFDPWVQFLANRDYAVFQMNFRGSWGYGMEFQAAGYGEWGQEMQNDVTDGTKWLIEQGIADPDRICIYGGSYGGYAALMGPVREPDLYVCAVSLNGVTDLRSLMRSRRQYVDGKYLFAHIGDYSDDRAELRAYSPVLRADEIDVPVLLAHGTDDRTVPFNQSQRMASALSRAGKEHKFVKLEDGDHSMSSGEHRVTFLRELESFLAVNLQ